MSPSASFPKTPTDEKPAMFAEPYVADSKDPAYSPPTPGMKVQTGTSAYHNHRLLAVHVRHSGRILELS